MPVNIRRQSRNRSQNTAPRTCGPALAFGLGLLSLTSLNAAESPRVTRGLQALYTFDAARGETITDRSGTGRPLNLKIRRSDAVQWRDGSLAIRSAADIRSTGPATRIINAVKRSNALSLEAWVTPHSSAQSGPARIASISSGASQRNLTLGQDGDRYDVRLRTTSTSRNGLPSTPAPARSARTAVTHIVLTRDRDGRTHMYVNGRGQSAKKVSGNFSGWDDSYPLVLGNESGADRPWLGTLHLVAVYSQALTATEVGQNFRAGARAGAIPPEQLARAAHEREFETQIAPLLARHCLECHDSATRKGGLNLSRKSTAQTGGESGTAIVPGNSADSLLWKQIASGNMPPRGDPLPESGKQLLRKWIDNGAVWAGEVIDPAIHTGGDGHRGLWLQRLTVPEYITTVRAAVGVDIAQAARELLPPDVRADGFSNTAYNLSVDFKHIEAYSTLAELIVSRMDVREFSARFSKSRSLNTDATMRKFVAALGKWLFRGPLDEREVDNYSGIATTVASAGGTYQEGVSLTLEAMLQSPRFIYRIEQQRGDGSAWPVTDYELASRLSYIIWGGPPDRELLRLAETGQLSERSQVERQARRMLQDAQAIKRSERFIIDWLNLDRLQNLKPDGQRYPGWDPALAADMRQETLAFFTDVAWKQKRPLSDLFNAQVTFATPRLAVHYGLQPQGPGLSRYDLSQVPSRGGLLTQGSLLTIGGDDASMVTRGLFLLKDVLRGTVNDPPPGLDTTPVPSSPGSSQRTIAEGRIASVSCGGCHVKFEPLAFGLERFDGIGAVHDRDRHGNRLRDDGEILFPGDEKPIPYGSSARLMDLLAGSDRVRESITWKVAQFALGRPLRATDARTLRKIHAAAREQGGTYPSLIAAIVSSDLVMMSRTEGP